MSNDRRRFIIICGATFMILFAGALRGGEVLMMEGLELVRRRNGGRNDTENGHVVIPLMGRFKNETGQRNLVLVLANVSVGGLEIRKWVDRLSELLLQEGRGQVMCPAICDKNGYLIERWKINGEFHRVLLQVQTLRNDLIRQDIEVEKRCNVYRSFRRGATT